MNRKTFLACLATLPLAIKVAAETQIDKSLLYCAISKKVENHYCNIGFCRGFIVVYSDSFIRLINRTLEYPNIDFILYYKGKKITETFNEVDSPYKKGFVIPVFLNKSY